MKSLLVVSTLFLFVNSCFASKHFFDVKLLPTIADRDLDFWFYMPPNSSPVVPVVKKVYRDQPFMLLMPSRVHSLGAQTEIDIQYDIKLVCPDGKVVFEQKNNPYYSGPVLDGLILPIDCVAELCFEESDKFGTYTIHTQFYENVSRRHYETCVKIELVEFENPDHFGSLDVFGNWIMRYYRNPDPVRSLSGILEFVIAEGNWVKENSSMLAFFRRILADNPFLWEYYARLYDICSGEDKKKMLLVAAMVPATPGKEVFLEKVESELKLLYEKAPNFKIPDTDKRITTAEQLDILWADFFASGTYFPIKQIVSALQLEKLEKMSAQVVYRSAVWSLISNCLQSDRVHQYCQTIYGHESLDAGVKKSLGDILEEVENKKLKKRN